MLPGLIDRIEKLCGEVGLAGEEIIIRSTGCPNGCARPYMAEIAFVGKAPGRYQVWLGGNASGTRLNRVWKDVIKEADIETELRPVLARFAKERNAGERFGDWCDRVFLKEQALEQPTQGQSALWPLLQFKNDSRPDFESQRRVARQIAARNRPLGHRAGERPRDCLDEFPPLRSGDPASVHAGAAGHSGAVG